MTYQELRETALTKSREPETIDAHEAGRMLLLSRVTVLELFKRGELQGYKKTRGLTSKVFFYRADVIRYAREVQGRIVK